MTGVRSRVTTHVLDAVSGLPATGVTAQLARRTEQGWEAVVEGRTDTDGRITDFGPVDLPPGVYRVVFDTGAYFGASGMASFYPEVAISFTLDDAGAHYHVPLLLSPYAFSTYRGS